MSKIEVVRKSHSQYVEVPDGQDPWVVAASHMTNKEVMAVAVHVLPTVALAPPTRVVGGKLAWRNPPPVETPRQRREQIADGADSRDD